MNKQTFEQQMLENYEKEIAEIQKNYEEKVSLFNKIENLIQKSKEKNIELPIINQILTAKKENKFQRKYVEILIQEAYRQLNLFLCRAECAA